MAETDKRQRGWLVDFVRKPWPSNESDRGYRIERHDLCVDDGDIRRRKSRRGIHVDFKEITFKAFNMSAIHFYRE